MEEKRISINDMPKWFQAGLMVLPVLGILILIMADKGLDNDFYFLYPTGEYIVKNGFPTTDILSMHSSMSIIVQQWLASVIFYFVYSKAGTVGMMALLCICYLITVYLVIKFCMLISENFFVSVITASLSGILIVLMFIVTRPQIFTYIIVLCELVLLESFVKTKRIIFLFPLPLLSLLLVNCHAAMWLMFFVFAAPYAASAIPIKLGKIKQEPSCSFVKLLIAGIACAAVGFLNPYGIKAMLYIFSSYGIEDISNSIMEMQPMAINTLSGTVTAIAVAIAVIATNVFKGKHSTRFVLLFTGTLLLALVTRKSLAYFLLMGFPCIAFYLKDAKVTLKITKENKTNKTKTTRLLLIFLIACALLVSLIVMLDNSEDNDVGEKAMHNDDLVLTNHEELDDVIEILNQEKGEIVLYTGFNSGQYLEFNGYHPYIDGRAELFLEKNNGEFDYYEEYYDLKKAYIYYKDFLDKYDFNYIITSTEDVYLRTSLLNDEDYEHIYDGENVDLFVPKE